MQHSKTVAVRLGVLLVVAFACITSAHTSTEDQWSEAATPTARDDPKLGEISASSKEEPEGEGEEDPDEEPEEPGEEPGDGSEGDGEEGTEGDGGETPPPPPPPSPSPSHPPSGGTDPSCNAEGWCQSPEAPYSQQCTDDAGPMWQDDKELFPNKHYWDGTPATPQLPSSGKCPPPLAAACARKGVKAAHLDGPISCGGKGFFCRIMPQPNWFNSDAKPMEGEEASFHLKAFKEANFYHCNTTSQTEQEREQGHPNSQGHCHGGLTDETYGWWLRDHWFRGYAGSLHCCCDYKGATVGVVDSCDIRRPVTKDENCRDPNEDARAKHMYKGGCSAAHKANFKDPAENATPGQETCWTVTSFSLGVLEAPAKGTKGGTKGTKGAAKGGAKGTKGGTEGTKGAAKGTKGAAKGTKGAAKGTKGGTKGAGVTLIEPINDAWSENAN